MYKKLLAGLFVFFSMIVLCAVSAGAETSGDFSYIINNDGRSVTITGYSGPDDMVIPEKLDGKTVTAINVRAFYYYNLTSVTIKAKLKEIPAEAFAENHNLKKVVLPKGLETIGDEAFEWTAIETMTIPDTVTSIGVQAFEGCKNLKSITIPGSVKTICAGAFHDCTALETVKLNKGLETIKGDTSWNGAFENCTSLKSINIPKGAQLDNVWIFKNCTNLKKVTFSKGTKIIPAKTFEECTSLETVTLPAGLEGIESGAFINCVSLKNITIPGTVKNVGTGVFLGCTGLQYVVLQDGVTSIDGYYNYYGTFEGCTNLEYVVIPKSLTNIGDSVFAQCGKLNDIYYAGSKSAWKKVQIGNGNDTLNYTKIHYNSKAPGKTVKAVSGIKTIKKTTSVTIKWTKQADAKGYIVEQYKDGKWVRVAKTSGASCTVKKLKSDTSYKFRIKAYAKDGKKTIYSKYKTFSAKTK